LRGVIQVGGRPARDVVIWLTSAVPRPDAPPTRAVLDQRNMAFSPRLLVVAVGTTVEMPNSDRVFHNVFSFHNGKRFDLGLYPAGTRKRVTFDRPGVSRVFCNIHPTMAAYVIAVASTRYAVSDASGRFVIADVEGDRHGYALWRAGAAPYSGVLEVDGGRPVTIDWP
jgi:plastocyanin